MKAFKAFCLKKNRKTKSPIFIIASPCQYKKARKDVNIGKELLMEEGQKMRIMY